MKTVPKLPSPRVLVIWYFSINITDYERVIGILFLRIYEEGELRIMVWGRDYNSLALTLIILESVGAIRSYLTGQWDWEYLFVICL